MKEWRQTSTTIGTIVLAIVAYAALMQVQFAGLRAEMRAAHDAIRTQMRDEHAAMRGEHTAMRGEHTEMRDRLNSIDRRTARIEGRLFGIEISQEPTDEE